MEKYTPQLSVVFDEAMGDDATGKAMTIFLSPELFHDWFPGSEWHQRNYPMNDVKFALLREKLRGVVECLRSLDHDKDSYPTKEQHQC